MALGPLYSKLVSITANNKKIKKKYTARRLGQPELLDCPKSKLIPSFGRRAKPLDPRTIIIVKHNEANTVPHVYSTTFLVQ